MCCVAENEKTYVLHGSKHVIRTTSHNKGRWFSLVGHWDVELIDWRAIVACCRESRWKILFESIMRVIRSSRGLFYLSLKCFLQRSLENRKHFIQYSCVIETVWVSWLIRSTHSEFNLNSHRAVILYKSKFEILLLIFRQELERS